MRSLEHFADERVRLRTRSDYFDEFRVLTPEELLAKADENWSDDSVGPRYGPVEIVYSDTVPATVIRVNGVAIAARWNDGPRIAPEFTAWDAVAWAFASLAFAEDERRREIEASKQVALDLHRAAVQAASDMALSWFESDLRLSTAEGAA